MSEEAEKVSEFVDTKQVQKTIKKKIPEERLLEIGEEMSGMIVRKGVLEGEIALYTKGRKTEIKNIDNDLEPLAELFKDGEESISTEVNMLCDFSNGKVRFETLEGDLISEEDMPCEGYQREFASLMGEELGKELMDKSEALLRAFILEDREEGDIITVEMLESQLAVLDLCDSMCERVAHKLRVDGVIQGRGDINAPFRVKPEGEESAEEVLASGAKTAEITEEEILAAANAVIDTQRAKTATVTRKLGVNPNRAADLIDILEKRGVVSDDNGDGRDVLMDLEQYEASLTEGGGETDPSEEEATAG